MENLELTPSSAAEEPTPGPGDRFEDAFYDRAGSGLKYLGIIPLQAVSLIESQDDLRALHQSAIVRIREVESPVLSRLTTHQAESRAEQMLINLAPKITDTAPADGELAAAGLSRDDYNQRKVLFLEYAVALQKKRPVHVVENNQQVI